VFAVNIQQTCMQMNLMLYIHWSNIHIDFVFYDFKVVAHVVFVFLGTSCKKYIKVFVFLPLTRAYKEVRCL
jgi:hypothetical protein